MSRLIFNRNGGSADEYGHLLLLNRLLAGSVIEGLSVVQAASPNMTVTVSPGSGRVPTGTYPTSYAYFFGVDTTGGESITITTANTSNPRIDTIVAYVDLSVTPSTGTANNPNNMLKLAAVAGTPNSSPVAPNTSAIQTAIGSSNPYIILANIAVGANVTQILTSNITDLRAMATLNTSILATMFAGAVQSYTNSGSAGGTFFYINLGGIKLLWGETASNAVGTGGATVVVNLPTNFFNSVQIVLPGLGILGTTPNQVTYELSESSSAISLGILANTNGSSQSTSLLLIGS